MSGVIGVSVKYKGLKTWIKLPHDLAKSMSTTKHSSSVVSLAKLTLTTTDLNVETASPANFRMHLFCK